MGDEKYPAETESDAPQLTTLQSILLGGVAGMLAPLSLHAVKLMQLASNASPISLSFPNVATVVVHVLLALVWGLVGAGTVYFLAERVKRHIFFYGIAAPYLILAIVSQQHASYQKQQLDSTTTKLSQVKQENNALQETANRLESKVAEARGTSESVEAITLVGTGAL